MKKLDKLVELVDNLLSTGPTQFRYYRGMEKEVLQYETPGAEAGEGAREGVRTFGPMCFLNNF